LQQLLVLKGLTQVSPLSFAYKDIASFPDGEMRHLLTAFHLRNVEPAGYWASSPLYKMKSW
jgi:hypothetical protein